MLPGWRYLWCVAYYDVARVEVPVVCGVLLYCPGGGTCGMWRTKILPGWMYLWCVAYKDIARVQVPVPVVISEHHLQDHLRTYTHTYSHTQLIII